MHNVYRWPTAAAMNTGAEGSPSADGRFPSICVMKIRRSGYTINKDGTRVIFNSNWNSDTVINVDVYVIDIPPLDQMPMSDAGASAFGMRNP